MTAPGTRIDVSVVIAAYNAMPYFTRCAESVLAQSIGPGRMEMIVVDDGSTDGTGPEADRLAAARPELVRVFHQANSGGPASPRNAGIGHARGRYLYFLDADDRLGPQALERLVALADEQRSDVVLGKIVGENGRGAPSSMFTGDQPVADLYTSRVYWTLAAAKLYRRELVQRHGLRFDETMATGEDQPFTAMAYLRARRISVLASYDCLYVLRRDDGGNTTNLVKAAAPRVRILTRMMPLVGRHTTPGPGRDHLMHRHVSVELPRALMLIERERDREAQLKMLSELTDLVRDWHTEALAGKLRAIVRLQYELLRAGDGERLLTVLEYAAAQRRRTPKPPGLASPLMPSEATVERGRVHAGYPFFRDTEADVPDSVFDITGEIPRGATITEVRLNGVATRLKGPAEELRWRGGPTAPGRAGAPEITGTTWAPGRGLALRITGRAPDAPDGAMILVQATDRSGDRRAVRARPEGADRAFSVTLPLDGGDWTLHTRREDAGRISEAPVPGRPGLGPVRRLRGFRPWYGRVLADGGGLRVRVGPVRLRHGVRRRVPW
ncbi:glycosyltransferase family A protein [Streptomyces sp. SM12]|uniref:glycosyltransferase family 2 protein n=1 Tax=Streptomyces sp. SM12 TaxID=1071602 RepID=UPI0011B05789|nr:glycosyltransferase family A protein [Streptomyces sp. SM12]